MRGPADAVAVEPRGLRSVLRAKAEWSAFKHLSCLPILKGQPLAIHRRHRGDRVHRTRIQDALEVCAEAATSPRTEAADSLRIGVDVVEVAEVAASIGRFGQRYLDRVYTVRELADCGADKPSVLASRLAARFAAKEAVTKVLAPSDAPGSLELHGSAASRAAECGISDWSLSITHEGEYAAAVVLAAWRGYRVTASLDRRRSVELRPEQKETSHDTHG